MIEVLNSSLQSKEKIMIYYIDSQNQVTQRIIRVVEIHEESILAYCFFRKQVRNFKLENILSYGKVKRSIGA